MQGPSPKSSRRSHKSKVGGVYPPAGRHALAQAVTTLPPSGPLASKDHPSSTIRPRTAPQPGIFDGPLIEVPSNPLIAATVKEAWSNPPTPPQEGGSKVTYQGRKYTVREGKRGGLYIMVGKGDKQKKVYLRK